LFIGCEGYDWVQRYALEEEYEELRRAIGGAVPTAHVSVDVSGRAPGDREVRFLAQCLLEKFEGFAFDDFFSYSHAWTLSEINSGALVYGLGFFDYPGWARHRAAGGDMDAEYDLAECASGEDEFSLWVTLGFSSEETELDVLHIVCGKEADPFPGFQGLYFERRDQGESEYALADRIRITEAGVELELNARGVNILELPAKLRFRAKSDDPWRQARAVFRSMLLTPNGGGILCDEL
jgi:hypothetical protein